MSGVQLAAYQASSFERFSQMNADNKSGWELEAGGEGLVG